MTRMADSWRRMRRRKLVQWALVYVADAFAMTAPGIGLRDSTVLPWLGPAGNPIRDDPGFQSLQRSCAQHEPAVVSAAVGFAGAVP